MTPRDSSHQRIRRYEPAPDPLSWRAVIGLTGLALVVGACLAYGWVAAVCAVLS